MSYGLKNALATVVRATHITLKPHIGKTVEVYVDDIVVKSHQSDLFLQDLDGVFQSLRAHKMMLNPEKCMFGVAAGKLLGFLVSHRGIEANPEKIRAIDVVGFRGVPTAGWQNTPAYSPRGVFGEVLSD